ncbi:YbhB/YbcL family Raf kinase inhibitor-like protein [Staphylococcus argenteus]|uniref:YbhB/YbcL family Raf kinase inhibitor-like protein n=1 Tax=Staphylococcus argenteus TaxID=985002 RepID=UPI00050304E0|nr:YbhB/YbcL family Raf kinase inhibitor-like protein [Staphylococcus argenteus]API78984.1 phosphatidylethanolamine-binding protein [Staphylococcus argenteus]MBE2123306.1 YbhB/YbcL family Raf kinase inhibitor-like protein [Staphylococcus argenteus]MBE2140693.1 YbhB/YbcL family Raf kinase inhibitor-like protein [Staphylococcus argenteus]MCG6476816.1 YbhB/YbcL family Raf kinase inhibitor-like protein [Staphylococcus argenteus]MCG9806262.1 YbhB/YbcL family Raf kinase inhibitor-like protein [Staph
MKINTEFKGNNIPYEYAAGADISDTINGNPIKSFPFDITELPKGTKYIAWSLIDYDAIPVCGFAWIHWSVANVSVAGDSISIKPDLSRTKGDYVQGKNSFTSGLLAEDFSEIENHYVGPTPPDRDHQYELTVYALDQLLELKNGFYLNAFLKEVNKHKLDQASINLIGRKI